MEKYNLLTKIDRKRREDIVPSLYLLIQAINKKTRFCGYGSRSKASDTSLLIWRKCSSNENFPNYTSLLLWHIDVESLTWRCVSPKHSLPSWSTNPNWKVEEWPCRSRGGANTPYPPSVKQWPPSDPPYLTSSFSADRLTRRHHGRTSAHRVLHRGWSWVNFRLMSVGGWFCGAVEKQRGINGHHQLTMLQSAQNLKNNPNSFWTKIST